MAEVHRFGGDFFAALDRYVQASVVAAQVSHVEGVQALRQDLQSRARRNTRWVGLADFIETWEENGIQKVGIRHPAVTDQARAAEYGDDHNPPAPLFRLMKSSAGVAGSRMDDVLRTHLGLIQ